MTNGTAKSIVTQEQVMAQLWTGIGRGVGDKDLTEGAVTELYEWAPTPEKLTDLTGRWSEARHDAIAKAIALGEAAAVAAGPSLSITAAHVRQVVQIEKDCLC